MPPSTTVHQPALELFNQSQLYIYQPPVTVFFCFRLLGTDRAPEKKRKEAKRSESCDEIALAEMLPPRVEC